MLAFSFTVPFTRVAVERLDPLVARVEHALRVDDGPAAMPVASALVTACATSVVLWSLEGRERGLAADAVRVVATALR